jgi:hypothetical protein
MNESTLAARGSSRCPTGGTRAVGLIAAELLTPRRRLRESSLPAPDDVQPGRTTMDLESPVNITAPTIGRIELQALSGGGRLRIRDNENDICAELAAALNVAVLALGGSGYNGTVFVKDATGRNVIHLNGRDQDIRLFNAEGDQTIILDGGVGDIKLTGADAAEDFELADEGDAPAGSVMVIANDGKLATSRKPYDRRVAGVISGAGSHRPGIVLGTSSGGHRQPVALAGRVCCRVDATEAPIDVGDLLTSSSNPGHAMKASDPTEAFGAVLGKALGPLRHGTGLIPILVALQ